jgi:hypothetical protein
VPGLTSPRPTRLTRIARRREAEGGANRWHRRQGPADQRIESFLADVLALAREDLDAIREGVPVLADCEAISRAQETHKRMKDRAARVCRALCRTRVAAEMHQRRGTRIAEHLKLVLSIIDRQVH